MWMKCVFVFTSENVNPNNFLSKQYTLILKLTAHALVKSVHRACTGIYVTIRGETFYVCGFVGVCYVGVSESHPVVYSLQQI